MVGKIFTASNLRCAASAAAVRGSEGLGPSASPPRVLFLMTVWPPSCVEEFEHSFEQCEDSFEQTRPMVAVECHIVCYGSIVWHWQKSMSRHTTGFYEIKVVHDTYMTEVCETGQWLSSTGKSPLVDVSPKRVTPSGAPSSSSCLPGIQGYRNHAVRSCYESCSMNQLTSHHLALFLLHGNSGVKPAFKIRFLIPAPRRRPKTVNKNKVTTNWSLGESRSI